MNYQELFMTPAGRTARGAFVGALIALLAAFAFYWFLVPGRTGQFALLVLLLPALGLHARRVQDMGVTGWLVLAPGALVAAAGLIHLFAPDSAAKGPVTLAALTVAAAFSLWCVVGKSRDEPQPMAV
jgi:uncharacterized membrane protein YhaH (DUF805 family)